MLLNRYQKAQILIEQFKSELNPTHIKRSDGLLMMRFLWETDGNRKGRQLNVQDFKGILIIT